MYDSDSMIRLDESESRTRLTAEVLCSASTDKAACPLAQQCTIVVQSVGLCAIVNATKEVGRESIQWRTRQYIGFHEDIRLEGDIEKFYDDDRGKKDGIGRRVD
jgi:hypothetical protein